MQSDKFEPPREKNFVSSNIKMRNSPHYNCYTLWNEVFLSTILLLFLWIFTPGNFHLWSFLHRQFVFKTTQILSHVISCIGRKKVTMLCRLITRTLIAFITAFWPKFWHVLYRKFRILEMLNNRVIDTSKNFKLMRRFHVS